MLIQNKADANLGRNDKQQTPLCVAVEKGYVDVAKVRLTEFTSVSDERLFFKGTHWRSCQCECGLYRWKNATLHRN